MTEDLLNRSKVVESHIERLLSRFDTEVRAGYEYLYTAKVKGLDLPEEKLAAEREGFHDDLLKKIIDAGHLDSLEDDLKVTFLQPGQGKRRASEDFTPLFPLYDPEAYEFMEEQEPELEPEAEAVPAEGELPEFVAEDDFNDDDELSVPVELVVEAQEETEEPVEEPEDADADASDTEDAAEEEPVVEEETVEEASKEEASEDLPDDEFATAAGPVVEAEEAPLEEDRGFFSQDDSIEISAVDPDETPATTTTAVAPVVEAENKEKTTEEKVVKVTSRDIRAKNFTERRGGYDMESVDEFLDEVSEFLEKKGNSAADYAELADEVKGKDFRRKMLKNGYVTEEIDEYLNQIFLTLKVLEKEAS